MNLNQCKHWIESNLHSHQWQKDHRTPLALTGLFGLALLLSITHYTLTFRQTHHALHLAQTHVISTGPLQIENLHLMGLYTTKPVQLPVSTVGVTLEGTIVFENNPALSRALIASPGKPVKVYQINDTLLPDVMIKDIQEDGVVVDNNGHQEKIPLPVESLLVGA